MEETKRNILISENHIKMEITKLGKIISKNYAGKKLYVLSLLRGSFIFTADIVRQIDLEAKIGFMTTSSYGISQESCGSVKIINDILDDIKGYNVLIIDDIMDTGITMKFAIDHVKSLGALTVETCVLLDKPARRKIEISPDYKCFTIPNIFVVGYGLNFGDYYRNVPYIFNFSDN